jgi:thiol-disulfide isomerase/thioredoxin
VPATAPAPSGDFRGIPIVGAGGEPRALAELLGGRPALVSFWAPWCEPCVKELPELQRLAEEVGPCGATVLGIAVGENAGTVAAFARGHRLTYPQFADEEFRLADALGQRRVPATVVFDGAQRIVFAGAALDARARSALAGALGAGPGAPPCSVRAAR